MSDARRESPSDCSGVRDGSRRQAAVERSAAAVALREARSAARENPQDESIDWAHALLGDRAAALALRARSLLAAGDAEAAESLLARGLLRHPDHSGLALLRCECLHRRGECDEAQAAMDELLPRRPDHNRTLVLAANIAAAHGRHHDAVALLRRAAAARPRCDATRQQLVRALLACGDATRAESQLRIVLRPSPILWAQVYRAQGRTREAIDVLEATMATHRDRPGRPPDRSHAEDEVDPRNEAIAFLAELLEDVGDLPALRRLIAMNESNASPTVGMRLGRAMLSLGQFHGAMQWLAPLASHSRHTAQVLPTLVVAAALAGEPRQARQWLEQLRETCEGAESGSLLADAWRRSLLGRVLVQHEGSRQSGADDNPAVLPALLRASIETLNRTLQSASSRLTDDRRTELENHRAACVAALGDSGAGDRGSAFGPEIRSPNPELRTSHAVLRLATPLFSASAEAA